MNNITCSSKKVTYEELSERLMQEIINDEWFKEWDVSEKEIREVKEIIKEIQISIASNNIKRFSEFFCDKIEIANTLREVRVMDKEEVMKDKKVMSWIKKWYFGEGKEVKQSYRGYLKKILNNKKIEAKYKMYVRYKAGVITTKKELYFYNENTKKAIYKYLFGFVDPVQPEDNWYKKDITIGINNFGDGWKIVALLVEP